jgi:PAS domain S-box-containing protein
MTGVNEANRQVVAGLHGELAGLVLETITEAVLVVGEDGRVVAANQRAAAMFGYGEADLLGLPVEQLMPARYRGAHAVHRASFNANAIPRMMGINRDLYAQRQDGSEFPVEAGLGPTQVDGQRYVIVSLIDITARKRDEREIVRLNAELAALLEAKSMVLEGTQEALLERTRELGDALSRLASAERRKTEEERKRLSLELHDEIGQQLTALSINLELIQRRCTNAEALAPIQNARSIVDDLVKSIREIVIQLRPPQLDDLGLAAALRWHLDRIRQTSILRINFAENLGQSRLPAELELSCFRVVQEALTNTLRHASAQEVDIKLQCAPERLSLVVSDDGVGFDLEQIACADGRCGNGGHFGLAGMRERVSGMGGRFVVISCPGMGCSIRVEIPLSQTKEEET